MARSLLGTRIRESRRSKKITQAALASQAGISASYLNLIEHNRRGIGGKTLLALARILEINPRELSEGADQALVDRVNQAAKSTSSIKCETNKTEEFIARFPGFSRLIARQYDKASMQEETLQVLSDQLNNDPYFSEAMHLMLTNITTIKSTTEILADDDDLQDEIRKRFLSNLLNETLRLSQTASEILEHFESDTKSESTLDDTQTVENIFEQNEYYIEEIEGGDVSEKDYVTRIDPPAKDYMDISNAIGVYQDMCRALPIEAFLEKAKKLKYNPVHLSAELNVPINIVLHRFAHLPKTNDLPRFGILECDGAGTMIFRKQLPTLSLPRYGSACPLWPVYRSLSQPLQPFKAFINTPTGERFLTYSYAQYVDQNSIGLPGRTKATMVFTSDYDLFMSKPEITLQPNLDVGLQCSVCPREKCTARRAKYILQ